MLHKLAAAATAGVEKKRIKTSELQLGMYVADLDCPWIESPFLVHGFVVKNEDQLKQLSTLCQSVVIDITRSDFTLHQSFREVQRHATSYETTRSFNDNLAPAKKCYGSAKQTVNKMFEALKTGGNINIEAVKTSVSGCVENIIHNPESMLWLSMIKHKDEYTAEHSVNVALLSLILGRAEGLSKDDLETLGFCAMLHDIGKVKIPDDILNKEGNLDDKEFAVMKMHTVHGKKMLLNQPGLPEIAAEIAFSHHEKMDGTGYPNGLSGDKIPYFVRMVAIVDAYDAITSGRIYCDAKPPGEAMRLLIKSKGEHHDPELLDTFIECVGIYPLGALAELNTGEAGFVLPSHSAGNLQPNILVLTDTDKASCEPHVIQAGVDCRDDTGRPYMIRVLHEDGKFGLRFADYSEQALPFIGDQ